MKRRWLLIVAFVASPVWAGPSTHCTPNEEEFFSCTIWGSGPEKVVSLCGGFGASHKVTWLQYRFGPVGRPEMVYPSQKKGSTEKFSGHFEHVLVPAEDDVETHYVEIAEVMFKVGSYEYLVSNEDVVVYKGQQPIKTFACAQPTAGGLGSLATDIR